MIANPTKKFLVVAALVALPFVVLCVHAFLPPVSASKLARLTKDTTQAEAERILGRPVEVLKPSVFGQEAWRYQTALRFGWVDVFFDEHGHVMDYNYERF